MTRRCGRFSAENNRFRLLPPLSQTSKAEADLSVNESIPQYYDEKPKGGYVIPGKHVPGYFSPLSHKIKEKVKIPVMVAGGIAEAGQTEEILRDVKADLTGVGRATLRDSSWAKNAMKNA